MSKRCPNGTRKNKKTGDCEPICKEGSQLNRKTKKCEPVFAKIAEPVTELPSEPVPELPSEPVPDLPSEPVTELPAEPVPDLPAEPVPEIPAEPVPEIQAEPVPELPAEPVNSEIRDLEKREHDSYPNDNYDFLYPSLNDPNFSEKIAMRKEFYDTKYDGKIQDIQAQANILCNAEFELMPHQMFVKNFLSFQTPYNSLLLYHGLGSGKTCSAIGISEEMRSYMKQVGMKKRIIVVAAPNVQNNFKLQLFDERKLKYIDGQWNINSCIGNSLLKEVNPTNLRGLSKEKIIRQIKTIINNYYVFMGYPKFSNFVSNTTSVSAETGFTDAQRKKMEIQNIKRAFNGRLIIIDEVHNVRKSEDNKDKRVGENLMKLAKHCDGLRLLMLSATPMYNSYKEIIWLTNLMNLNDSRGIIRQEEVFDKQGNFVPPSEGGRELLHRKLTGYVSYIRGENPYTFPYRIYPKMFSKENSILVENRVYPTLQMNLKEIGEPLKYVDVFVSDIGEYQEVGYQSVIQELRDRTSSNEMPSFENMDSFGYMLLLHPLEALNIVYPSENNADQPISKDKIREMIGKRGLSNVMTHIDDSKRKTPLRHSFEYKPDVLEKYGNIFNKEHLHKYSSKISKICDIISKSTGIVMIYSQYIDGGILPIALALEEMGFARTGSSSNVKSLFKTPPSPPIDAVTMLPRSEENGEFNQAKYIMITGDEAFSSNNSADIKLATDENNRDGKQIKVILISRAGSEGLDFKNIRQIHILEPWYNMNRIEQIIGRAVRNLSHCMLPFEKRNVEVYLHATRLKNSQEEAADLYVYRVAEKKAVQIGRVTRLLKETAVDCILNIEQTNFTAEKMVALAENQNIKLVLSTNSQEMTMKIGDEPFSEICDYMERCEFSCQPTPKEIDETSVVQTTYNTDFMNANNEQIQRRIRNLFKDHPVYKRDEIIRAINIIKIYPIEQIFATLTHFIKNKNEFLTDKYGRLGNLINKDNYYAFQPVEINDEAVSVFDRSMPVDYKRKSLVLELPKAVTEKTTTTTLAASAETVEKDQPPAITYESILQKVRESVERGITKQKIGSKETDWYMHANQVLEQLETIHKLDRRNIKKHILFHRLDTMPLVERKLLLDQIYGLENASDFEQEIRAYYDERILRNKDEKKGIYLANDGGKPEFYVEVAATWKKTSTYEESEFLKTTDTEQLKNFKISVEDMFDVIGFMVLFHDRIIFKLKDLTQKRTTGANCESAGKPDLIKFLNRIVDETIYSNENTKTISKISMCVLLEILSRDYTREQRNDKVWFLSPEKAAFSSIVKGTKGSL